MPRNAFLRWATHVPQAYDNIAEKWQKERATAAQKGFRERQFLDQLTVPLHRGAAVLDVGCGCGMPIMDYLIGRGFQLTGLDASVRMLVLARAVAPDATLIQGDVRTAEPGSTFDAIVAWDSIFHIPRGDHSAIFNKFRSWLKPGGRLLVSLGGSASEDFTSEMFGETFYYSGHDPSEALTILKEAGFEVEHWEVDDSSSRGHIAILAVRS